MTPEKKNWEGINVNDRQSFVAAILAGDLDSTGAFADFLEEQDAARDRYLGVLLRRRWKRWRKDRDAAAAGHELPARRERPRAIWEASPGIGPLEVSRRYLRHLDMVFRRYLLERFSDLPVSTTRLMK